MLRWGEVLRRILLLVLTAVVMSAGRGAGGQDAGARWFVDCTQSVVGDGSAAHPWNSLAYAETHIFAAGDRIALKRGTTCQGSFSPKGSGIEGRLIRLTAYSQGLRPRIVAPAKARQVLLLFNQEYWQIDSLDLSGANTYGVFVTGDAGTLHHIYLRNLYVHDVVGGAMKNKDNGLLVVGPSSINVFFDNVVVDGVVAAHTNQWAGILVGGGPFPYKPDAPLNNHVTVRNSSVQDVYGDGIVLFRDSNSVIEKSTAWQTGMQPTETIGTPNAIWTWTCSDCIVRDNEAFLTDSPGVDGGAYDIDWDNTRNTVERNYAHDTQGYCIAVFAAGYVTSDSVVRDNLCIDNGESPRLAKLQGAVYLHTWNDGVIRGLRVEHNTIVWNPPVSTAAAVVSDGEMGEVPAAFTGNRIESAAAHFYRSNGRLASAENIYRYEGQGDALFTIGEQHDVTLAALQRAGFEKGTTLEREAAAAPMARSLRLDATMGFALDADGLLADGPRAQLMVLRSLAAQYGPNSLAVTVHLREEVGSAADKVARANALIDLDTVPIRFEDDGIASDRIRLLGSDRRVIAEWHGFANAATLGEAVRAQLGAPRFARMGQAARMENKR